MVDIWQLPFAQLDVELVKLPSVVTWSRLEPLSLSSDLTPGLQALVADPLWMIGRQWQFAELRGEDGGTPITAISEVEHAPISRFRAATDGPESDILDESVPLEARIEAEGVSRPAARVRAEAGLQALRMLAAGGVPQARQPVTSLAAFVASPAAVAAVGDPDAELPDERGRVRDMVYAGRVPDGQLLADALEPLAGAPGAALTDLPAGLAVSGGAAAAKTTREVLGAWLDWYRGYFVGDEATPASWNPARQEYGFAVQANLPSGSVVLESEEYTSGRVDWTDFEAVPGDIGATPAGRDGDTKRSVTVPTPPTFPGMPADRLWQFEDAHVYLGGLEAGPTDLAKMALVEFALGYGVDWFVLPLDVPAGSVIRVSSLRVRDTFGFDVFVPAARQPGGWSMFGLTPSTDTSERADLFVVPPVVSHVLESDPLEEVALFRDEMANLVWGVERTVQSEVSGEVIDRAHITAPVSLRQQLPGDLGDAAIVYRLMSPVPDNWIPFVAVKAKSGPAGSLELERRPLLHFRDDGTTDFTHPRGTLLLTAADADRHTDRLRLVEEEVPRDGAVVTRRYQLARTPDGGSALWIGRRKRTGQGEGWSGLRFDTALAPGQL